MDLTKYTVVTSDDFGVFEDRVNQLIGDGWKLQGGVTGTALPDTEAGLVHVQWSQALVLPTRSTALEAVEAFEAPLPLDFEREPSATALPEEERSA
jgi:hypothetical protein